MSSTVVAQSAETSTRPHRARAWTLDASIKLSAQTAPQAERLRELLIDALDQLPGVEYRSSTLTED